MYFKGLGVLQDHEEALKWFRLAALQGDADAQYVLGDMYKNGLGGPQDYEEALTCVNGGAKRDHLGGVRRDRLAAAGLSP